MGSSLSSQAQANGKEVSVSKVKLKDKDVLLAIEEFSRLVPDLRTLHVQECKLKKIPQEINSIRQLVVLRLDDNNLSSLPSMSDLDNLRELYLTQNKFSSFPNALLELNHLELLDLSSNAMTDLPDELKKMKALRSLNLAKNSLSAFPSPIFSLASLISLDLSENRISSIPKQISCMKGLESLVLRRNDTSAIPEELCECLTLTNLDISENQVQSLPSALGKLVAMTSLSAQHNKISQLPSEIGNLSHLKSLKLHDNELQRLPATFGRLTKLTELCLQENQLEELPTEIGRCRSLRKLYAEYNNLSSLPSNFADLENLVVLILHHNKLMEVPKALTGMRQLLRLSLDDNPLSSEVKEIIQSKGALGLLTVRANPHGSPPVGTVRGSLRGHMTGAGLALPRGSTIIAPRSSPAERPLEKKGLLATLRSGEHMRKPSSSATMETLDTQSLTRLRTNSLTSDKLKTLAQPARVDSPEDEMKKFVENRRKHLRERSGTLTQLNDSLGSVPTVVLPSVDGDADKKAEKEKEKEDIPSYSKFKYAFERMLTQQDFSTKRQETLKKLPPNQKWKLLTQYKGSTLEMLKDTRFSKGSRTKTGLDPQDYIPLLRGRPSTRDLEGLSRALESQPSSWVAMFIEAGGIEALVNLLNSTSLKRSVTDEDYDVIVHALTAMKVLLGLSLRSVLTTTDSVNCIVLCLGLENVKVRALALDNIAMVLDVNYVGLRLVHEGFHNYQHLVLSKKEQQTSRFAGLVEPLIQNNYPLEALVNSFEIINRLIGEEEDLEARLDLRKEFVSMGLIELLEKLRLFSSELLHIQLDQFEEELEKDYEEMLSKFEKDKVLQHMETQGQSNMSAGDHLRVLLGHTGQQLIVPYVSTTTVNRAIEAILQKQPLNHPENICFFGLFNTSAGQWLDDPETLLQSLGHGELICEFKMRPLKLKVMGLAVDGQQKEVIVDPNATVSSALTVVMQVFGFKNTSDSEKEESDEYGLVLPDGTWLDEMKKLGEFRQLLIVPNVLLKRKPWQLKVSFPGHTVEEMPFDPDEKISRVIEAIITRLAGPSQLPVLSQDYGLLLRRRSHKGVWLKPTRTLSDYPHLFVNRKYRTVELMLKPISVDIVLPEKQINMKLQFNDTVESLLEKICSKAGLPAKEHSLFMRRSESSKRGEGRDKILLNPSASLKEQGVPYTAVLELGPKQEFVASPKSNPTVKGSQNIWEEPNDDSLILFEDPQHQHVRAGTLNKLVQLLTSEDRLIKSYDDAFIMTFQSFCEPDQLFEKLVERFNAPSHIDEAVVNKIHLRVCLAIRDFVQAHYHSLGFPTCPLAGKIEVFINANLASKEVMHMHAMIQRAISTPPVSALDRKVPAVLQACDTKSKLRNMSEQISIFDIEELEVAKQLTLRTGDIYTRYKPVEFLKMAWSKPTTAHLSPNLLAAIALFNHVSQWVGTMIVTEEKVRTRAKIMDRCIKIAQHLREMNNYQLLMAFVSGMNNSALLRLKWTRAKLPKRALTALSELERLMSMEGSFKLYRAALEASSPPCIPYVGVYLTDLTFIEDGNDDEVVVEREGKEPLELINFSKRTLVHSIISTLLRYQQQPYGFARHPEIQAWLDSVKPLNENDLYRESLAREPRGATRADIQ